MDVLIFLIPASLGLGALEPGLTELAAPVALERC